MCSSVTSPSALYTRAIVVVLDSVGVGELPDAASYGDRGSNTVGNIAKRIPLRLPTLRGLGFALSVLNLSGGMTWIVIPLLVLNHLHLGQAAVGWVAGCLTIWSSLFAIGNVLYGRYQLAVILLAIFVVSGSVLISVINGLWDRAPTPVASSKRS